MWGNELVKKTAPLVRSLNISQDHLNLQQVRTNQKLSLSLLSTIHSTVTVFTKWQEAKRFQTPSHWDPLLPELFVFKINGGFHAAVVFFCLPSPRPPSALTSPVRLLTTGWGLIPSIYLSWLAPNLTLPKKTNIFFNEVPVCQNNQGWGVLIGSESCSSRLEWDHSNAPAACSSNTFHQQKLKAYLHKVLTYTLLLLNLEL